MIIGIAGRARSGKTTVADILIQDHGFRMLSFAEPLKELLLYLNPDLSYPLDGKDFYEAGSIRNLREWVELLGFERTKDELPESRAMLQRLGTGVRNLDEDFWVNALFTTAARENGLGVPNIVIPDVRYTNEAEAIQNRYGLVWRIHRESADKVEATHASERGFSSDLVNHDIYNDGDISDLRETVNELTELYR